MVSCHFFKRDTRKDGWVDEVLNVLRVEEGHRFHPKSHLGNMFFMTL